MLYHWFDLVACDKCSFESAVANATVAIAAIDDSNAWVDYVEGKREDKVEQKKEPVFIKGVELINLDDCDGPGMRLHCNSNGTDDNDIPNLEGVDVKDSIALCS